MCCVATPPRYTSVATCPSQPAPSRSPTMPRDLPLSNGKLLVLFDREYRIADLYFPHVGKENHAAGNVFRLGVWVDGAFRWVDGSWQLKMQFGETPMVTDVTARNADLGVELRCEDAVD